MDEQLREKRLEVLRRLPQEQILKIYQGRIKQLKNNKSSIAPGEKDELIKNATQDTFFFATHFVKTYNEKSSRTEPYPDYPFLRDKVFPNINMKGNCLWLKSQRMIVTISFCVDYFWSWLTIPEWSGWFTSRKQDNVDDGGSASTWKSLMGKIRFFYNNTARDNPWLIEHFLGSVPEAGKLFKYMTLVNPRNGAVIIGEAPMPDSPTGEGYTKALVDEAARVPRLYNIHGNLMMSCPNGTHYVSYPNGRANKYADIVHTPDHFGFKIIDIAWTDHPDQDRAWYEEQRKKMTAQEIGMRLDRSFVESTIGKVWKRFSRDRNLKFGLSFDIGRLELCFDFGAVDATSVGFLNKTFIEIDGKMQPAIVVKDWLEIENTNYLEVCEGIRGILAKYNFTGDTKSIRCIGDPQVNAKMVDTGITLRQRYASQGFNIEAAPAHESKAVLDEIDKWFGEARIFVDDNATDFVDSAENWTWPIDSRGNPVMGATQPAHSQFSHAGKSFEYWFTQFILKETSKMPVVAFARRTMREATGGIE